MNDNEHDLLALAQRLLNLQGFHQDLTINSHFVDRVNPPDNSLNPTTHSLSLTIQPGTRTATFYHGMAYRGQWFERVDKYDLVEEALDAFMNAVTANAPVRNAHYQQAE